jgi:hypothetical protein
MRFSVTPRLDKKIRRAIAGIPDHARTPIKCPNAIYDEDEQRWISDAEVPEIGDTASPAKAHTVDVWVPETRAQPLTSRFVAGRGPA